MYNKTDIPFCQVVFSNLLHNIFMVRSEEVLNAFAEKLKELMNEKGYNIKTFAEEIGIPKSTINDWTLKKTMPAADSVCIIADFFGVTTDYLLGREY